MNNLAKILVFKILATVFVWVIPLLCLPGHALVWLGLPPQPSYMFMRMLGWAYLALCVGYTFALSEALKGRRLSGAIWAGIVSNGGACILLVIHGGIGEWQGWGTFAQVIMWGSAAATAFITWGLYYWGVRG